jgi:D-glycero-alpha-D-manno-heptose-7-phosphate kinase
VIVTRTPYRLSLFGGGTDYNDWFEQKGGLVVSCAMQHYCYLSVRRLPPFFSDYQTRAVYSKVELVQDNSLIEHPSIRGCLKFLNISEGVEIHHHGDLPARSGIGSSSSFTAGLLNGLHALKGNAIGKKGLAEQAIEVEQQVLGEAVGIQDQIVASFGGAQTIRMGPGPKWVVEPLIVSREYIEYFQKYMLVGFSGIDRLADGHAKKKISNIRNKSVTSELEQIAELSTTAHSLLQKNVEMEEIGKLLDTGWRLKRTLSTSLAMEWMDQIYDSGIRCGAFGGKLMGAGGGGFFYFLAPPSTHQSIREALPQVKVWIPFAIDFSGSTVVVHNDY